jgi:hypothetical protein
MNSPCSKLQGITSAPLCFADKAEYTFTLNPSHAASSGKFKFKTGTVFKHRNKFKEGYFFK